MKVIAGSLMVLFFSSMAFFQHQPAGAWEYRENGIVQTMIIADNYFSIATYDKDGKKFIETHGGTMDHAGGMIKGTVEFNSTDKEKVGKRYEYPVTIQGNEMLLTSNGRKQLWKRMDDGKGPLAGNWRITGREQNGQMTPMNPGPRKTIKIMTGTRFQWAAINTDTGEFFGTGGGKYILANGVYTETIEFFSRDSSRVGMSLSFNAKVEGREWHHSGKSSKGEPVNEIWKRER